MLLKAPRAFLIVSQAWDPLPPLSMALLPLPCRPHPHPSFNRVPGHLGGQVQPNASKLGRKVGCSLTRAFSKPGFGLCATRDLLGSKARRSLWESCFIGLMTRSRMEKNAQVQNPLQQGFKLGNRDLTGAGGGGGGSVLPNCPLTQK